MLSLPLLLDAQVLGAMNVYAHPKDAFGPRSVRIGESFARPAAVAVRNAHVLDDSQRLAAQLENALSSRGVIDQAMGVLMSRTGAGPDEAFERLRTMSQTQHVKVVDVSRALVEQAVRRARARRPGGDV